MHIPPNKWNTMLTCTGTYWSEIPFLVLVIEYLCKLFVISGASRPPLPLKIKMWKKFQKFKLSATYGRPRGVFSVLWAIHWDRHLKWSLIRIVISNWQWLDLKTFSLLVFDGFVFGCWKIPGYNWFVPFNSDPSSHTWIISHRCGSVFEPQHCFEYEYTSRDGSIDTSCTLTLNDGAS